MAARPDVRQAVIQTVRFGCLDGARGMRPTSWPTR